MKVRCNLYSDKIRGLCQYCQHSQPHDPIVARKFASGVLDCDECLTICALTNQPFKCITYKEGQEKEISNDINPALLNRLRGIQS